MVDMTKKYKTRDGRDVRILCVDGPGPESVIGVIRADIFRWYPSGTFLKTEEHVYDLIEQVPEVVKYNPVLSIGDRHVLYVGASSRAKTFTQDDFDVRTLVGHLRITQPAGNTDITKIKVEVVPLP